MDWTAHGRPHNKQGSDEKQRRQHAKHVACLNKGLSSSPSSLVSPSTFGGGFSVGDGDGGGGGLWTGVLTQEAGG